MDQMIKHRGFPDGQHLRVDFGFQPMSTESSQGNSSESTDASEQYKGFHDFSFGSYISNNLKPVVLKPSTG
jgi:hypothetical protein